MYKRNYKLLNSKYMEFLLPTVFTSMAGNISVFVDSVLESMFIGTISLSVMQVISPITTLVNMIYWMVGLGGSLVCSIAKAEFDEEKSNNIFTSSILSMVAIGIIIMMLSLIFSDSILRVLCSSDELIPLVYQFFHYYLFGLPFLCYMMAMSYFTRSDGFTRLPFVSITISNLCNLVLDIVLIKYMNLGLSGAALATTIGYIVGSICISAYFLKNNRTLKFIKIKWSSFVHNLINICKSGFSTASGQLYLTIKLLVINTVLLAISGNIGLTAFNMCFNILFIISIFLIGIAQSMSPIVGVYYKEKDYGGVEYVIKKSFKMVVVISILFVLILTIYPQILLFVFSVNNPNEIPYMMNSVRMYSLNFIALGVNFLYLFYAQAIQKDKLANIIQILEGLILPIMSIILLSLAFGDTGLWSSFFISEVLVLFIIIAYSRRVNRKSNGEYHGFFINKTADENFIDYTINGNIREVTGLSAKINEYLGDNITSTRVSLAIEEMLANIIKLNKKIDTIDVYLKDSEDEIIISFKDNGIEYNPVVEVEDLNFDNISMLNKIADKIDYSRVLGLNSTVITIKK